MAVIAHERRVLGVDAARLGVKWEMPMRHLTIDGTPAFQIGYSCGTCGLVLRRRVGAPSVPPVEVVRDRLNDGLHGIEQDVVDAFSAQLPRGEYLVLLLDIRPRLVLPGSPDDYFTVEAPATWKTDEVEPASGPYYRLGERTIDATRTLFQFAMPITDPVRLDDATVRRYVPGRPTAVALTLLDVEGPWNDDGPWDGRPQHWGLTHFLLDGHHKTAAAARADATTRLLAFVDIGNSLAHTEEVERLPALLA